MGRGFVLFSVVLVGIVPLAGCSESDSSADPTDIVVTIDTCRNPFIIENDNKWITDDTVPVNLDNESELRGSFEKVGDDTATFRLEDGYTLEYRYEGEFPTESCVIG